MVELIVVMDKVPSRGKYGRRPAALRMDFMSGTLSYLKLLLPLGVKSGWLFSWELSAAFQISCTSHRFIYTQRRHSACGWINLTFSWIFTRRMSNWSKLLWVYFYSINLFKWNFLHLFPGRFQEGVFISND